MFWEKEKKKRKKEKKIQQEIEKEFEEKRQKKRKNARQEGDQFARTSKQLSVLENGGANGLYPRHGALEVKWLAQHNLEDLLDVNGLESRAEDQGSLHSLGILASLREKKKRKKKEKKKKKRKKKRKKKERKKKNRGKTKSFRSTWRNQVPLCQFSSDLLCNLLLFFIWKGAELVKFCPNQKRNGSFVEAPGLSVPKRKKKGKKLSQWKRMREEEEEEQVLTIPWHCWALPFLRDQTWREWQLHHCRPTAACSQTPSARQDPRCWRWFQCCGWRSSNPKIQIQIQHSNSKENSKFKRKILPFPWSSHQGFGCSLHWTSLQHTLPSSWKGRRKKKKKRKKK